MNRRYMTLGNLTALLQKQNAEIVILLEDYVQNGERGDFFYSFCFLNETLFSLNVQYPVLSHYRGLEVIWPHDRIFLNEYRRTGTTFELVGRENLGPGGDPRVVSNGKVAYAIIIGDLVGNEPEAFVYDLLQRRYIPIKINIPDFCWGKNWQPFLQGDDLYFVHELTPFRVMKVDLESGQAITVREEFITLNMPCYFYGTQPYPMLRGGSNANLWDNCLYGTGHGTSTGYRHEPFFWLMDSSGNFEVNFSSLFSDFYQCGYNLIDPSSLFRIGDTLYLGLCCTERDWMHTQLVTNMLIAFKQDKGNVTLNGLDRFFQERALVNNHQRSDLNGGLFFCTEMAGEVDYYQEHSGKVSSGEPGYLVAGPGKEITAAGKHIAELTYLTLSCSQNLAGEFSVFVFRTEGGNIAETRILGKTEILPTNGEVDAVRVEFDTKGLVGWNFETRVSVYPEVRLNAFHIRTQMC